MNLLRCSIKSTSAAQTFICAEDDKDSTAGIKEQDRKDPSQNLERYILALFSLVPLLNLDNMAHLHHHLLQLSKVEPTSAMASSKAQSQLARVKIYSGVLTSWKGSCF